jgi:hypothetical protein
MEGPPPNKPMKLSVAFGARSLSASRWADRVRSCLGIAQHSSQPAV